MGIQQTIFMKQENKLKEDISEIVSDLVGALLKKDSVQKFEIKMLMYDGTESHQIITKSLTNIKKD